VARYRLSVLKIPQNTNQPSNLCEAFRDQVWNHSRKYACQTKTGSSSCIVYGTITESSVTFTLMWFEDRSD